MRKYAIAFGMSAAFVRGWVGYGQNCPPDAPCPNAIRVEFRGSNGTIVRATECYPESLPIDLCEIGNNIERINVFSNSTLVNIPAIAMDVRNDRPSTSILNVFVTNENVFNRDDLILSPGGINFAGLSLNANDEHRVRFAGYITGNLTGNVRVGQVRRLQVDGAIQSEVFGGFAYAPDGFSVGTIQAGSIASAATLLAGNNASRVVVFGNIDGAVEVLSGSITDLIVQGDVTGSVDAAANILRTSVTGNVAGSITTSGGATAPESQYAYFGEVDGNVRLARVVAAGSNDQLAISVLRASAGRIQAVSITGGVSLNSLSGGINSGLFVENDLMSSINCNGTIDRIEVAGDAIKPAGILFITAESIGQLSIAGNFGVGCDTAGALV